MAREASAAPLPDAAMEASRYAARLTAEIAARAAVRIEGAAHVLAMHQYVTGGIPTDSERRLRVGAVSDLDASASSRSASITSRFGTLHRPQEVVGAVLARALRRLADRAYFRSRRRGQGRSARCSSTSTVAAARASRSAPLTSGRPLEIWSVASLADEARDKATDARRERLIVDVRVRDRVGVSPGLEVDALFALEGVTVASVRGICSRRPTRRRTSRAPRSTRPSRSSSASSFAGESAARPTRPTWPSSSSALLEVGRGGAH